MLTLVNARQRILMQTLAKGTEHRILLNSIPVSYQVYNQDAQHLMLCPDQTTVMIKP